MCIAQSERVTRSKENSSSKTFQSLDKNITHEIGELFDLKKLMWD